jgi:excisionase family DNA binding protein
MSKTKVKSYLTPNEVAELLMVSPVTVRQWAQKGDLKALTTPGGHRRFLIEDIAAFAGERGIKLPIDKLDEESGLRVLIVDDDKQLANFLVELLQSRDADIKTEVSNDGFDAGRKVQTFHPHVILLDLMMPGINGFEVCHILKQDPATSGIRIIAMTGFHAKENVDRILKAGAEACLPKPLDTGLLFQAIGIASEKKVSFS